MGGDDCLYLSFEGILAGAPESLDAQVLLDPLEELLHLPAAFVGAVNITRTLIRRVLTGPGADPSRVWVQYQTYRRSVLHQSTGLSLIKPAELYLSRFNPFSIC
jgi:hypothetical protein